MLPPVASTRTAKKHMTAESTITNSNQQGCMAPVAAPRVLVDPMRPLADVLRFKSTSPGDPRFSLLGASFFESVVEYEFVSAEALRSITEEQAGQVIHLLCRDTDTTNAGDEQQQFLHRVNDNDDRSVSRPEQHQDCVVWLSARCFLWRGNRGGDRFRHRCKLEGWCVDAGGRTVLVQLVDLDMDVSNPNQISNADPPVEEGDAMLRILGRYSGLREFDIRPGIRQEELPISAAALQEFVGTMSPNRTPAPHWRNKPGPDSQSVMKVNLGCWRLSEEHKRVLAYGCHRKLHLVADLVGWESGDGVDVLVDAIRSGRSPTRLTLKDAKTFAGSDLIKEVVEALQSESCVEALVLDLPTVSQDFIGSPILGMLANNRGLRSLRLNWSDGLLSSWSSWLEFWGGVAAHPTLQVLDLPLECLSRYPTKLERMAKVLQSNTSLQFLLTSPRERIDQLPIVQDKVLPILQLNRFRPKVDAILTEPDLNQRRKAFWSALVDDGDDEVRNTLTFIYFLLTKGSDLFVQGLPAREGSPMMVPKEVTNWEGS